MLSHLKKHVNNAAEVVKNVITGGGYEAIRKSVDAYKIKIEDHQNSERIFNAANEEFKITVERLGTESAECMTLLRMAKDFVERLSYSRFSSNIPNLPTLQPPDLRQMTAVLSEFDAVTTAGKGAGLGLAASTGAWMLVAHFGTASTGAAIVGLSGAAAHSAILAWLGGGALAAGGGGMMLGSITIFAVALLPLVAYSAYKSYKEAAQIDTEATKVEDSEKENLKNAQKLLALKGSAEALREETCTKRTKFIADFGELRSEGLRIAEQAAEAANTFADAIVSMAQAKGAFA
jgi:hypothetical protein